MLHVGESTSFSKASYTWLDGVLVHCQLWKPYQHLVNHLLKVRLASFSSFLSHHKGKHGKLIQSVPIQISKPLACMEPTKVCFGARDFG